MSHRRARIALILALIMTVALSACQRGVDLNLQSDPETTQLSLQTPAGSVPTEEEATVTETTAGSEPLATPTDSPATPTGIPEVSESSTASTSTVAPTAVPTTESTAQATTKPSPEPTVEPSPETSTSSTASVTSGQTSNTDREELPPILGSESQRPDPPAANRPTPRPTATPTTQTSSVPTARPTTRPTTEPTTEPTTAPTATPTSTPTSTPTPQPTATLTPTEAAQPSATPTPVAEPKPTPKQKTLLMLGDSITERNRYTAPIAEATGLRIVNAGLGATTMGAHGSWSLDPFSFEQLATSYANGDLSAQRTLLDSGRYSYSATFAANIEKLEQLDIQDVDIISIAYGTNDYIGCKPLGTAADLTTTTFAGDLNSGIRALQAANPKLEIILYTPPWRWNPAKFGGGDAAREPNAQGIYLSQFAQAILDVGSKRGFAVVDVYNESGIGLANYIQYLSDGLHLNTAGYSRTNQMLLEYFR